MRKHFWKALSIMVLLSFCRFSAHAVLFVFSGIDSEIPDADDSGLVDVRTISASASPIAKVRVTLEVTGSGNGAFNGDLYATLQHGTGFAVLLNRVGSRAEYSPGYSDNGLNITFDDDAANGDVHLYRMTLSGSHDTPLGGSLTGIWASDGRNVDPDEAMDSSQRTSFLNSFAGLDPNGQWTLFLADLEAGGTARLTGWSIEIVPVPEVTAGAWIAALCLLAVAAYRRAMQGSPQGE